MRRGGLSKFHDEPARTKVAPELLPEQHLDIGLIIDHKNKDAHAMLLICQGMPQCGEERS